MPLSILTLDKLKYDELVAEARASLPALSPGWTDHNAHDPGITLIELFAWLAEADSYRLDQVPEASYRAFLQLVGIMPNNARVAQTAVIFTTTAAAAQLPAGASVQSDDGNTIFQITVPLHISDAQLKTVLTASASAVVDNSARNLAQCTRTFLPLGETPQVDDAIYLGFDRVLATAGTEIRLWMWTADEVGDRLTRELLQREANDIRQEKRNLCSDAALVRTPHWRQHYGATTVWEYYAGSNQWLPLERVVDDTRALTLNGGVHFLAPVDHAAGLPDIAAYEQEFFIRCRLMEGEYDCPPRCTSFALNAVLARHVTSLGPESFKSIGRAAHSITLSKAPVVPKTTKTLVRIGLTDEIWHEAPTWDGVRPHDRVYVLAPDTGMLTFGDGRIGRVPPADASIAVQYLAGGGISGNVPAKHLTRTPTAPARVSVKQPFAAIGGAPAETLASAKARAVRELAEAVRAVTLDDFEQIAMKTPGVPVARAHAIADYDPAMQCISVGGSVTVVVLSSCPEERPTSTRAMLAAVKAYLDRRRVLTTELHVVGPMYTTVKVTARLQGRVGVSAAKLRDSAALALRAFFHPLRGGRLKTGWPIGRSVYRSELLALLNALDGVAYVEELEWSVDGNDSRRCGNIAICPHGLVVSGIHEITVNQEVTCNE